MKTYYIYRIARGYRFCEAWTCKPSTRKRVCVLRLTPNPTISRYAKWGEIARWLKGMGIPVPKYAPTKSEASALT